MHAFIDKTPTSFWRLRSTTKDIKSSHVLPMTKLASKKPDSLGYPMVNMVKKISVFI